MNCIICLDNLVYLKSMSGNPDGATEFHFQSGYGSGHDMCRGRGWICDSCLTDKIKNKVVDLGSYEHLGDVEWVEENYNDQC